MIRGRDFLEVRQYLVGLDGEASARTRTGRAYYAAFLEALAHCERHHGYQRRRGPSEHAEIARLLATVEPGLVVNLENLRRLRNTADYELSTSTDIIVEQALWSGVLARSIIGRLDELASQSTNAPDDR